MQTCSTFAQNTADGESWEVWSNGSAGCITVFPSDAAFSATWDNSGDFLARTGLVSNTPQAYTAFGTISAQFAESKTGTAGSFSYIGLYGWSLPPNPNSPSSSDPTGCIEWYIVDDSYNTMPVNPGGATQMGTATIDGGDYILYLRPTTGTGGNNCGSQVQKWNQYYSIRTTSRTCGQISVTDHFNAWAAAGMTLGNLQEAQVLVEAGGGDGSIDFTTASVTATQ